MAACGGEDREEEAAQFVESCWGYCATLSLCRNEGHPDCMSHCDRIEDAIRANKVGEAERECRERLEDAFVCMNQVSCFDETMGTVPRCIEEANTARDACER